jgi:hypothetical protein
LGILDQMKKDAESKKQLVTDEADVAKRREQVYQQALLPTLQKLLQSVQELMGYLKELPPIEVTNYSPKRPELGKLLQGEFRINTDGKSGFAEFSKLMQINMATRLKGEGSYRYTIVGKLAAEAERDFLNSRSFKHETQNQPGENGVPTTTFMVEREIPVIMRFEVDMANSCVKFTELNYDNFSTSTQNFQPADLTDEWIDQFLRFMLRKDKDFVLRLKRRFPT